LLDLGTQDIKLQSSIGGPVLTGEDLKRVVERQLRSQRILEVIARQRRNPEIVAALVRDPRMGRAVLADEPALRDILDRAKARLESEAPHLAPIGYELLPDSEHGGFSVAIQARMNGGSQKTVIDAELCASPEFEELCKLSAELRAAGEPPFVITVGEKTTPAGALGAAVADILAQARKGVDIQRYKGLGEMNPEQLWETTMNPETRVLLQVRVEDAYEADDVFSTLMGDEVEPRRRFIEENALSVRNLDI
jgi:DNA gyrase subunit B